ncbi:hypothetical protein K504DRAFT_435857 [Pleomassaria siparia CBS 279.74]|uniref:Uncharacterized protein n=1 Tax=Pleomassaria siparia CBS 279.74 TaxID=1314801 RepID=A0A6G1K4K4_9PLEO|nr:hypothetical protein K504DRAFT_435857 [Pleomassaria siparia CBS 279.74]
MTFLGNYRSKSKKDQGQPENEKQNSPEPAAPTGGTAPINPTTPISASIPQSLNSPEAYHSNGSRLGPWTEYSNDPSISANAQSRNSLHNSRLWSQSGLSYPSGDFRNASPAQIQDIKCEVMVNWLHSKQEERIWTTGEPGEGVVLKKSKGTYVCCPIDLQHDDSQLYQMVAALNVRAAMTVNTRVIKLLLARTDLSYVQIDPGLRLQVIPNIEALPYCQKYQSAAFVASTQLLIVWEDDPKRLLEHAGYIQDTLMKMIWEGDPTLGMEDKTDPDVNVLPIDDAEEADLAPDKERRVILIQAVLTAATIVLVMAAMGSGWRNVAIELVVDGNWIRLAFLACMLPQMWLSLFFFQALVGNIAQIIGPTRQMSQNSRYYSGKKPRRIRRDTPAGLPHVTIQMPVYKEGLHAVIEPTIRSIKAAISTYELQGGTANVFINDDGMQLVSPEEATERQEFYEEHRIGWVARPKHNPKPKNPEERTFNRRGKFKKASNMNYALNVSDKIEILLSTIQRTDGWNQKDENTAYGEALRTVIDATKGETWADGNIRMGDYILLIDSDTRVPEDCLLDAVSELEQDKAVAILQFSSGVMNVTTSFFEKGITFFTNLIYTQINYAVANGDVAPFVGHNAFLRWEAMQKIHYNCKYDGTEKYWSEKTVSEDFDMALRLQSLGYLVRLGAYQGDGFKEGVSLTVYDELARWEKYAYGCNELMFHPLRYWFTKGPFTRLFKNFMVSKMPLPSKITILAYIGTYYALGSAWLLTVTNYFLIGWFNGFLDHYYVDSFKIYFAIIVVFTALGNISLAWLRYRLEGHLLRNLLTNFKWVPLLVIFLGGVSLHISQALLSHMFGYDMQWGATAKEVENVTFFEEIPRVIKRFKYTFVFCIVMTATIVVLATVVPFQWRIEFFTPIWPLACCILSHFLLPIVLNPNLMLFTW